MMRAWISTALAAALPLGIASLPPHARADSFFLPSAGSNLKIAPIDRAQEMVRVQFFDPQHSRPINTFSDVSLGAGSFRENSSRLNSVIPTSQEVNEVPVPSAVASVAVASLTLFGYRRARAIK